jgi:hypothetical protein
LYKDSDPMDFDAIMSVTIAAAPSSNAAWPGKDPVLYPPSPDELFAEKVIHRFR